MKKRDVVVYGIAVGIVVVLNALMATVVRPPFQMSSIVNLFLIGVALFAFRRIKRYGAEADKKRIRMERYGIWGLVGISTIWFVNRVAPVSLSDAVKIIFAILIVRFGMFFLFLIIARKQG